MKNTLIILSLLVLTLSFVSPIPNYYWTFDDGSVAYFESVPTSNQDIFTSRRVSLYNENIMCIPKS